jgi:hypothetical protein
MKIQYGIIGLVVGLIAVGIAIFQNDLFAEPEPVVKADESLKELAVEASKKLIREKLLNKEDAQSEPPKEKKSVMGVEIDERHNGVQITYMALGFAAMILGTISWAKKDHMRVSGGAVALGLVAVAWQYVLIGIVIAVVIFVLANLGA